MLQINYSKDYINLFPILVKLYFGKDKNRYVTYSEFSQLIHDFHDEYAYVAFKAKDTEETGFISSKDFFDIMVAIKSHLLTDAVSISGR